MKKIILLCLVCLLFMGMIPEAIAEGPGSLRIELDAGGKKIEGTEVRLYKAGVPIQGGYLLEKEFGGGYVTDMDVMLPALAQWLAEKEGKYCSQKTDGKGIAAFYGLEEGLYLVKQEDSPENGMVFSPFLITLPWDGNVWEISASPKLERPSAPMPDTSDPGTLDRGIRGMALAALGLYGLVINRKKWLA